MRKRRTYVDKVGREFIADVGPDLWGLDAGCGDGGRLPWLNLYVNHLWASDYNPTRLARAAQNLTSGLAFLADLRNYPIANDSMHLIWFNHAPEHIKDDCTVLA
jgi:SAM-dependent methyltransferase